MFDKVKLWFVTNLALILGVALALIGLYASWLHFVTVPNLTIKLTAAEANGRIHEANYKTCTTANFGLAGAIERQNTAIKELARLGALNRRDVGQTLRSLEALLAGVPAQLDAYKPDPTKTDCQNAMAQVEAFKAERARQ